MGIKITGVDTPFGGISWEYTESAKKGVQAIFYFLETRRILINPCEMEIKNWCELSAIEIKNKLADILPKYDFNNETVKCIRTMIGCCNSFLDDLGAVTRTGIIYKNEQGDWEDTTFSKAMKKFREGFRDNINALSEAYKVDFPHTIPAVY